MEITFRRPTIDDAEMILKWRTDEKIARFQFSEINPTLAEQIQWLKDVETRTDYEHFLICVDDRPIGYQSYSHIDHHHKTCSSGNYIYDDKDKIYGGFLHCYLMDHCFHTMGMHKIINYFMAGNDKVIKMQTKLKCSPVGILKEHILKDGKRHDVHIYELLASEWANHPKPFKKDITLAAFEAKR